MYLRHSQAQLPEARRLELYSLAWAGSAIRSRQKRQKNMPHRRTSLNALLTSEVHMHLKYAFQSTDFPHDVQRSTGIILFRLFGQQKIYTLHYIAKGACEHQHNGDKWVQSRKCIMSKCSCTSFRQGTRSRTSPVKFTFLVTWQKTVPTSEKLTSQVSWLSWQMWKSHHVNLSNRWINCLLACCGPQEAWSLAQSSGPTSARNSLELENPFKMFFATHLFFCLTATLCPFCVLCCIFLF